MIKDLKLGGGSFFDEFLKEIVTLAAQSLLRRDAWRLQKLPTEKWTSEFDLMEAHPNFNGIAFWLDKEGSVFRTATYIEGRHSSVSGYFDMKLDVPMGKDLTGTVKTNDPAGDGPKAEATFHVTVK